jgi:hypothetical protein
MSNFLHGAVDDAQRIAGDAYFTGCIVSHPSSRRVTLYLASAPEAVLEELEALHPGVYVIINDAPRPYSAVLEILRTVALDRSALSDLGIEAVSFGPTPDGYVLVGVLSPLVPMAQATYDSIYGCGVIRVFETEEGTFFGNEANSVELIG